MRDGFDATTLDLSADDVERIRAFLDGQSPIKLAVWMRHEQQGVDGPLYDHHLVLGIDERVWQERDMRALDEGLRIPHPVTSEPTWIDLCPLSESVVASDVVRVTATRSRRWKGESESEDDTSLCVACSFDQVGPPPGPLQAVQDAAREAGIAHDGGSLERPAEPPPYPTVLYDRDADS